MKTFFRVEETQNGEYYLSIGNGFHELFDINFSNLKTEYPVNWNSVFFHLFNLSPVNFYQYVSATYSAQIQIKKDHFWPLVRFSGKIAAEKFANECNKRVDYCIKNNYFI